MGYVASRRCVATRFVFGLSQRITTQNVGRAIQEAWRQDMAGDTRTQLDVRWCGKSVASVFLAASQACRKDDEWQDTARLEECLEAVLSSALTSLACRESRGPAAAGKQQPPAFMWSADHARATDTAMYS